MTTKVPASRVPFVDKDGIATPYFFRFLQSFFAQAGNSSLDLATFEQGYFSLRSGPVPVVPDTTPIAATARLPLPSIPLDPSPYLATIRSQASEIESLKRRVSEVEAKADGRRRYAGSVTAVYGAGTVNGLTLTGTVQDNGSLTLGGTLDLSAPPAIGGTTPAAGSFTTASASSWVKLPSYTVAGLPAAGTVGRIACVTDATAPTFLGALVGGGTSKAIVLDNGSAWVSG